MNIKIKAAITAFVASSIICVASEASMPNDIPQINDFNYKIYLESYSRDNDNGNCDGDGYNRGNGYYGDNHEGDGYHRGDGYHGNGHEGDGYHRGNGYYGDNHEGGDYHRGSDYGRHGNYDN